jgi:signal transduction histidine kinase
MREYLRRLLARDYEVQAVPDGASALAAARTEPPDLVLSDVMMPYLDGFGLLRSIRADSRTRVVPVILLSARAGEESAVEGLDAGADDYLAKPFTAHELMARVRTHLELSQVRREWAKQLEAANKELESFSYSVSHDLRSPLAVIDGFTLVLLEQCADKFDDRARNYLSKVRSGVKQMTGLIDGLLDLSRITRGGLQKLPVDLTELARDVISELQTGEPFRKIVVNIADGMTAVGDPRLLRVLLANLLGNAWKYSSKKEEARVSFEQAGSGGDVIFSVADNGAGFDMAHAEKLFAPFHRLEQHSQFRGTGIGLATVQRIISRHGGRVWAEGAVGLGATLYFTLGDSNRLESGLPA